MAGNENRGLRWFFFVIIEKINKGKNVNIKIIGPFNKTPIANDIQKKYLEFLGIFFVLII